MRRIDSRHDVGSGGGIQAKGTADPGHLACREHEPQAQQRVILQHQQSRSKDGSLQEGGQAQADDLLAPLNKAVRVATGYREHIQGAHGDLDEQDAAALQVGEKALDDGVAHHDDNKNNYDGTGDRTESAEHSGGNR